jgi:phage/plasmid-like protein (TIGR03299 family)
MAHELELVNGKAQAFFVGRTPWHGLGTILDAPPTVHEGIRLAGLDWSVGLKPLVTLDSEAVDHRATYRKSDGKIFGVVGPAYTPLQNADAFQWFQPLLDTGEVCLHTAGSLQEGRKVWMLAKINKAALEIADGDMVERFILLSNSHDGTRAVRIGFTPIRVVCANTLRMAHDADQEANRLIKVLHTKNVVIALDRLREMMNVANSSFEATAEQYRKLARCHVSRADMKRYIKIVLGVEKEDDAKLPAPTLNKIRSILVLAEKGRGNDAPAVRGTLWAAYNGLTEYLGTEFSRSQESRLDALWFGQNSTLSSKALEIALMMAS